MKVERSVLLSASLLAASVFAASAWGQRAAPHYEASPDVYKIVSENDQFRIIEATWKPGQRDEWHSHSGREAAYRLTDCDLRIYTPDGKFQDRHGKKAEVNFNPAIGVHSFQNVGTAECKTLIVQKKGLREEASGAASSTRFAHN